MTQLVRVECVGGREAVDGKRTHPVIEREVRGEAGL